MNAGAGRARLRAVFRCDASAAIGGGHLARCLALAEALAGDGWWCGFAVRGGTLVTVPTLASCADGVLLLPGPAAAEPAAIGRWAGGDVDLLIVDHYRRDASFETACRPWARRILVIDDLADRLHDTDLLLDPGCGRRTEDYVGLVPPTCQVMAGSSYALLRPEFVAHRNTAIARRCEPEQARRLLVAFGATDPGNASTLTLKAIAASGIAAEVDVLLGGAAPHLAVVQAQARVMPQPTVVHAGCDDVAAKMVAADLAIGAGGGMAWERCCLGLPALVIEIAENQHAIVRWLAQRGAAVNLGPAAQLTEQGLAMAIRAVALDRARLQALAAAAAALCDGEGTARVLKALGSVRTQRADVTLRAATMADAERMFVWQRHPSTRRYSFCTEPPAWGEHITWLRGKLADPNCLFRVILVAGRPAGTLRLDRREMEGVNDAWEVSIVVAPEFRGGAVGSRALRAAAALHPHALLMARVKPENVVSRKLFSGEGYRPFAPGVFVRWPGDACGSPAPTALLAPTTGAAA